jgi:hypothetical protein
MKRVMKKSMAALLAALVALALALGGCSKSDSAAASALTQEQIAEQVALMVAEQLAALEATESETADEASPARRRAEREALRAALADGTASPEEVAAEEARGTARADRRAANEQESAAQTAGAAPVWTVGDAGPNGGLVYYAQDGEFYEAMVPGKTLGILDALPTGWIMPDMEDLGLIYNRIQKTGIANYGEVYYISMQKTDGKNRFLRISDNKEAVGLTAGRKVGVRAFDPSQPPAQIVAASLTYAPSAAEIAAEKAAADKLAAEVKASADKTAAQLAAEKAAADKLAATATAAAKAAADKAAADKAAAAKAAADKAEAERLAILAATKYHIGDTGPAGGVVFYDKGNENDGWRYMEAAPEDLFGVYGLNDQYLIETTKETIGSGKANTQIIADLCRQVGQMDALPVRIQALNIGGYNDWFMPSHLELVQVYKNLAAKGLGGTFAQTFYHSSSEQLYNGLGYVHCINFENGERWGYHKTNGRPTRPIRAFL